MKNFILLLFELILLTTVSYGQNQLSNQQKDFFDKKYGVDVMLHVGKLFYPESNIASGDPYWGNQSFYKGDIVIDGERYNNQKLMYNIYLQNFILIFNDLNGAEKQIILDSDKIDSVFIDEIVFIKNPIPQIDKKFVQLVHEGAIPCYVSWEKQKIIKSSTDIKGYSYTNEKNTKYVIYDSVFSQFKNNRELLKIFQKDYKNDIKRYLLTNYISIKNVNTMQLEQMIEYIEKVIN